uniref:NECAP PHear domain-containing protein n=1 Tax=Physcomitrium patens TaxID=3218 RepID=A0A7I3Z3G8_PHYPA
KILPRGSSGGYKFGDWLQSDKIWTGRLRIVSLKATCEVRLEYFNTGELFPASPVMPGKRDATVENVVDLSRYFV